MRRQVVTFNDQIVFQIVSAAHDPPIQGAEHDRTLRMESYVKDFKPLKLGTIELEKGVGELSLQATQIPGRQVMEFRLLTFRRLVEG